MLKSIMCVPDMFSLKYSKSKNEQYYMNNYERPNQLFKFLLLLLNLFSVARPHTDMYCAWLIKGLKYLQYQNEQNISFHQIHAFLAMYEWDYMHTIIEVGFVYNFLTVEQ